MSALAGGRCSPASRRRRASTCRRRRRLPRPGRAAARGHDGDRTSGNEDPQDPTDGYTALLSIPVQVGDDTPVLDVPGRPPSPSAGKVFDLDIASLCNVWTLDPADAADLTYEGTLDPGARRAHRLRHRQPGAAGRRRRRRHRGWRRPTLSDHRRRQRARRSASGSTSAPPPSCSRSGRRPARRASRATSTWRPTSSPGVASPDPDGRVTSTAISGVGGDGQPERPVGVTLQGGPGRQGTVDFRIVMSDVADSSAGPAARPRAGSSSRSRDSRARP